MSHDGKADQGKLRFDLLPVAFLRGVVAVLTFGAAKYRPESWREAPDARRRYYAPAMRHLTSWWAGERLDEESGLHHLLHAAVSLAFPFVLDTEEVRDERRAA